MKYEQICLDCKKKFTHEAPIQEGPTRVCPKCGGNAQVHWKGAAPAVHNTGYSPVHPRKYRGRGGSPF